MAEERWKFIVFNKDISEQKSLNFYTNWAEFYDQDMVKLGFKRQFQLAQKLKSFYPDEIHRKNLKILDIAAGTGLVGVGLKQEGFEFMDAVDGNQAMLEKLKEKGIYQKAVTAILGNKNQPISPEIPENHYDVAIIMGGFAQSHLPIDSLYQVAKTLKSGGLFINLMTRKYLDIVDKLAGLEPLMEKMETEGIWSKVEIFLDKEEKQGIYHIYRKT